MLSSSSDVEVLVEQGEQNAASVEIWCGNAASVSVASAAAAPTDTTTPPDEALAPPPPQSTSAIGGGTDGPKDDDNVKKRPAAEVVDSVSSPGKTKKSVKLNVSGHDETKKAVKLMTRGELAGIAVLEAKTRWSQQDVVLGSLSPTTTKNKKEDPLVTGGDDDEEVGGGGVAYQLVEILDVRNWRCMTLSCLMTLLFYTIMIAAIPVAVGICLWIFKYKDEEKQADNSGNSSSSGNLIPH
jgi:hypothetical protein